MSGSAGIQSLAVRFPAGVRTNDYFRQRHPEAMAKAEDKSLSRIFSTTESRSTSSAFDEAMKPYLSDPFRGTVERRVLAPGESTLALELQASKDALEAAHLGPSDLDAVIAASFIPETLGAGHAAYLCRDLGIKGAAAWNMESACSGSVVALQNAATLVRAGEYRRVMVVTSCNYTRINDEADTFAWFTGDGAAAFIVGPAAPGEGVLGSKVITTQETCGAFFIELSKDAEGKPWLQMKSGEKSGRIVRDTAAPQLLETVHGALDSVNASREESKKITLRDIDFFVFNTPVAWYASFFAQLLGVDPERTISMYTTYGNMGPVLVPGNLYHAAHAKKIKKGDLVLLYSFGAAATVAAVVMRWGDVGLGPLPPPSSELPRR